jgi:CRP-like cAMP-binding protein
LKLRSFEIRGTEGPVMAIKRKASFNPKTFLAKVGEGRSIGTYRSDQIVFSQGDSADAVFYIQKGKVKINVVSEQGKEAVVAILGTNEFFGSWNERILRLLERTNSSAKDV